jgi:hypothetical protein
MFLYVGANGWGKGDTLSEAKKNWLKNVPFSLLDPKKPVAFKVYEGDETMWVDEFGYLRADTEPKLHSEGEHVLTKRR